MYVSHLIFNILMNSMHKILENISSFEFFNMCPKAQVNTMIVLIFSQLHIIISI